jgi:predicted ABC-type exoprotein transport system permease subunit
MKEILSKWKNHLIENDMTYYEHFKFASFYSFICFLASVSLLLHAVFPCWLQYTGSDLLRVLSKVFRKHNDKTANHNFRV